MKRSIPWVFLMAGLLLLASCRYDPPATSAPDTVFLTVEVMLSQTALAGELTRIAGATPTPSQTPTPTWITGDLGWGQVTGVILDAASGLPVAGAAITCVHTSYAFRAPCSGTTRSDENGFFVFDGVFFHDTDTILLTVDAPGYVPQVYRKNFFTQPLLKDFIYLPPVGWTPEASCTLPVCAPNEALVCLSGNCPGSCGYTCIIATISATAPMPLLMCTAPACPGGVLACGDADGCPGGCGTVCLTPTP